MNTKQKTEEYISKCWETISGSFKEYNSLVVKGMSHISLLGAHITTDKAITSAKIENTDTFKIDPSIRSKLQFSIKKEVFLEKDIINKILEDLEKVQCSIVNQCDKVFSLYRNNIQTSLSLNDVTMGTELSFSISEKIEALDKFKRNFIDNHLCRMYSLEYFDAGGDLNRLYDCWKVVYLESLNQELASAISS